MPGARVRACGGRAGENKKRNRTNEKENNNNKNKEKWRMLNAREPCNRAAHRVNSQQQPEEEQRSRCAQHK